MSIDWNLTVKKMANAKQAAGYSTWDNIGPSEPLKCDRYYTDSTNHTHFIYGGYEGIPENLLINLAIWLVGGALRNAILYYLLGFSMHISH